jgi:hypothetical protein
MPEKCSKRKRKFGKGLPDFIGGCSHHCVEKGKKENRVFTDPEIKSENLLS